MSDLYQGTVLTDLIGLVDAVFPQTLDAAQRENHPPTREHLALCVSSPWCQYLQMECMEVVYGIPSHVPNGSQGRISASADGRSYRSGGDREQESAQGSGDVSLESSQFSKVGSGADSGVSPEVCKACGSPLVDGLACFVCRRTA